MPQLPGILPRAARKIKQLSVALRLRPRDLSLGTTVLALTTEVVASRLRALRVQRVSYPVTSLHVEYVHIARAGGRGVIFVSVHSNYAQVSLSWFYRTINSEGWTIHAVSSDATQEAYRRVFQSVLPSSTGLHKAARVLKRGEGLVLLQDIFADDGVPIRLYDRVVPIRLGAARLAQMTDSLILPYIALSRRGKGMIHWWPPIDPREGDVENALVEAMAGMIHTYPRSWSKLAQLLSEYDPVEPRFGAETRGQASTPQ